MATPPGSGDRAVIRLSGPRARTVASKVAGCRLPRARRVVVVRLLGVRAAAWVMPAPHSYTREEVVELHLPGAEPLVRGVMERCLAAGARAAEPGEFTRRAFLNGRMDLAQAEAVLNVIASRSADELRAAVGLLRGEFSRHVRAIEEDVLTLCADVEAAIDFEDQDVQIVTPGEAATRAETLRRRLDRLLARTAAVRVAEGRPTAFLYGRPNAGKSSLFNRLTAGDAIVSAVAGTTRDLLAGECEGVRLLDAPGVFQAEGADAEAARRAREEAEHADVWVVVIDGAAPEVPEGVGERPAIWVVNKADVAGRVELPIPDPVFTSAVTGQGIGELRRRLSEFSAGSGAVGARFAVSLRQRESLRRAEQALGRARRRGLGIELVALELRAALEGLGAVTGRQVSEDLLTRVFERFCVGK